MNWHYCGWLWLTLLSTITSVKGNCVFDVNQEIAFEPLVLIPVNDSSKTTYELLRYTECSLKINSKQNIVLACPGENNYLNLTNDKWNVGKCIQQNNLQINNELNQYGRLECKTRPIATTKITGKLCFKNKGVVIQVGFEVNNNWFPLLEICHNIQISQTYYSKHNLILPKTHCLKTPKAKPMFIEGDARLYDGLHIAHIYSTRYQLTNLKRMIGNNASLYINQKENKFLARGHLAPNGDFPMDAWHTLTYFYINTAPQWQSINGGGWSSLESKIRKISIKMKQLNVITGTRGVMLIEQKKFYLGNERVPVPEYFWKLIHNPEDDSCMGFITKNDPYLKRQPHPICENVCTRYNWKLSNLKLSSGYIYCCEYHRMRKVIEEVPTISCKSALRYPHSL
ncbi:salivary protein Tsal2A-like isoform X1 [Rhodnius prolixus]|uniref:Endonuclease_NS domain-containing protein n=1 Tax=Rhodnius prolixus TaxID=13249 RepID=T1IGF2_RHOPR